MSEPKYPRPPWHDEAFYQSLTADGKALYDETDWEEEAAHPWLEEDVTYVSPVRKPGG